MDFRPLDQKERRELLEALRGNVQHGHGLRTGRDTSFAGAVTTPADEYADDEVIDQIRAIPTHYEHA